MKILLLHIDDVPWRGPWTEGRWDLIVDLGYAGRKTYAEWEKRCGSRIISIHQFADTGSYSSIRKVIGRGRGRLVDRMGLDWWEIIAAAGYQRLQPLYLLQRLQQEIPRGGEYWATRKNIFAEVLSASAGISVFAYQESPKLAQSFWRSLGSARLLNYKQIVEIAFDKWDSTYAVRRHAEKSRRAGLQDPVVLLPSAYSNVTHTLLDYAAELPQRRFLLASTRRSGRAHSCPQNVSQTSLAAYAVSTASTKAEETELLAQWRLFAQKEMDEIDTLRQMRDAGLWNDFPSHLKRGLRLREAWHCLMKTEPVIGVLSADDLNYYTRIPLILAGQMGLGSFYSYHGALDGALLFKKPYADRYFVKGEMERDYMLRASAIEPQQVEVGAPSRYFRAPAKEEASRTDIVFFSQPYEVLGGRTVEIYREILPALCELARRTGRTLAIKLHPFESVKDRRRLLACVLGEKELNEVRIVSGTALDSVLSQAWCGIGVDSSIAVECALRGIAYFICAWLDRSGFEYGRQLGRFGAGKTLEAASELQRISEIIAESREFRNPCDRFCSRADKNRLDEILFLNDEVGMKACAC